MADTTRLDLPVPDPPDQADVPSDLTALMAILDNAVLWGADEVADRPTAASLAGRLFYATDEAKLYFSTGAAWQQVWPALVADGQITEAKLATDAVTKPKIASSAVGPDEIEVMAIHGLHLHDELLPVGTGTADPNDLALRAIGITEHTVVAGDDARLTDQRVPIDGSVTGAKIAAAAVTEPKIANDAVTQAKLADNAVGSAEIADAAVGTSELADNAVTNVKVASAAAILASKIKAPFCFLRRNANINISTGGGFLDIPWESEQADNNAMWAVEDPTKLYAKTAGWYEVSGHIVWGTVSGSDVLVAVDVTKNSSLEVVLAQLRLQPNYQNILFFSAPVFLDVNDYVKIRGTHDRVSALAVVGVSSGEAWGSQVSMKYITP